MDIATIDARLRPLGLRCRGGLHPGPEDGAPPGAATLVLVGNVGSELWPAFAAEAGDGRHPLDAWTRRVVGPVATEVGADVVFPFEGPPYWPFQRWALRAEAVHASPIGPLIHPEYGLWHAYRAALAFRQRLDLPPLVRSASPCDGCAEKPCLKTCPVAAFDGDGYDVDACAGHLRDAAGAECMAGGCLARRACPIGRAYAYEPAHARFHMEKFLAARA